MSNQYTGSPPTAPQTAYHETPQYQPGRPAAQRAQRTEPRAQGAKFNFARGFWTAAGVIAAWAIVSVVVLIVMIVLGLFFRGVAGLNNSVGNENCGVNPNTGLIECR